MDWIRRYILFHKERPPNEMGAAEVEAFLIRLAVKEHIAASTQNQAFSALLFLYREVLHKVVMPNRAPQSMKTTVFGSDLGSIDALCAKNRNACPPSLPKRRCAASLATYRAPTN